MTEDDGSRRRSTKKKRWGIELSVAAMGVLGAVLGGALSNVAGLLTQSASDQHADVAQVRTKRTDVYFAYLGSADTFETDTGDLINAYAANRSVKGYTLPQSLIDKFNNDRSTYQGEINQLYVFGSDAAWVAHQKISADLPTSLPVAIEPLKINYDPEQFNIDYDSFLRIVCVEVNSDPRTGCLSR